MKRKRIIRGHEMKIKEDKEDEEGKREKRGRKNWMGHGGLNEVGRRI